jgi:hypothetical protein
MINNCDDIKLNISEEDFQSQFLTQDLCLEYLAQQKWEYGYICKKCGHDDYYSEASAGNGCNAIIL